MTRGAVASLASLFLVFGLVGCATASVSPHGTATASSQAPSASADDPRPIIPLSCEKLLPTSTAQSAISSTVSAHVVETTPPSSLTAAAYRQTGGFDCEWTATTTNSNGRADGVSLVVLPNALDALQAYQKFTGVDGSAQCAGSGDSCSADFAVSTFWVSLSVSDSKEPPAAVSLSPLISKVTSSLTGAAPTRDAWVAPSGSFSGSYFCNRTAEVAAHLQSVVGATPDLSAGGAGGGPGTDVTAFQETGVAFCPWLFSRSATDDIELDITTLPGGSWAIDGMNEWAIRPGGDTAVAPVSVAGAQAARAGCATYGCSGYLSYRHSLIAVGINSPMSIADFTTLLGKLITDVS